MNPFDSPPDQRARLRGQGGFSYLWVLMLVACMGIGLSIAAEIDSTVAQRDQEKQLLAIGRQFRRAIASYYETQVGGGRKEYPLNLEQLLKDDRVPGIKRHLRKVFVDPLTGKPEWGVVRVAGRIVGVHSLSPKSPIKVDGFEGDEASFKGKGTYADWVFTYPANLVIQAGQSAPGLPMASAPISQSGVLP